mgnify:CR=1 FL=1
MGLENIFSQEANFSGMLKTGSTELYVTQVFQKAFIDLNEWGAEAAAVSGSRWLVSTRINRFL